MTERPDEIASLRGTKGVYQQHAKNIERDISELKKNLTFNNEDTIIELTALKNSYSDKVEKIKELDHGILSLLKQDEREKELEINLTWEDNVQRLFAKVEKCLEKLKTSNSSIVSHDSSSSEPSTSQAKIKLPKLELPKFRGDITQWQGFWDQFNISIHENISLSNIEEFNYLRTFLTDSAYSLISGLSLISENYEEAVNVLNKRFGNKQTLIFSCVDSFVQLPVVKNSNNVIYLQILYDKIKISVRNLYSLDMKKETYGNLLISIINARIPEELRFYLSRQSKNNLWNIDDVLTFLKTGIEAKKQLISNSNYDKSFDGNKDNKSKNSNGRPFTSQSCLIVAITITHVITQKRGVHVVV